MLPNPAQIDKYLYITKTPTWKVRSLYFFGIFSWLLIILGYINSFGVDPLFTYFVIPIVGFLTLYHFSSFGLNIFYTQYNINIHNKMVSTYWNQNKQPTVDIFLPICGENSAILENTWKHIQNLNYSNLKVYVLDDTTTNCENNTLLAKKHGFTYLTRTDKGYMKKAGNLLNGYSNSSGEFIAIFDADFAPHPDFLIETVPYMQNPRIGIIQTPQFFDTTNQSYTYSPISYHSAVAEEPFYRIIQVTRNRFGGSVCCGSNALYRRQALKTIGGPYQVEYSEDAHTGFALTNAGHIIHYLPIILAIGLCPSNFYTFFHQQHRWCMGSMRLLFSKFFWLSRVSWKTKLCYITGFFFYLHHPLIILFSFHLFWVLFIYNDSILNNTDVIYLPHLIFAIVYLFIFPIAKVKIGYFLLIIARTYAYTHAIITKLLHRRVGWISTNTQQQIISSAFTQTILLVSIYCGMYLFLLSLSVWTGDIHLFDFRYWSIQFWIFYNFGLSILLVINLIKTSNTITKSKFQ